MTPEMTSYIIIDVNGAGLNDHERESGWMTLYHLD